MECAISRMLLYSLKCMHSNQGHTLFNKGKLGQKCSICNWETNRKKHRWFKNCNKEDEIVRKQDKWKKRVWVSWETRIFKSTCWQMVFTGAWSFGIFAPKCSSKGGQGENERCLYPSVFLSLAHSVFCLSFSFYDCFQSCGAPLTGWLL